MKKFISFVFLFILNFMLISCLSREVPFPLADSQDLPPGKLMKVRDTNMMLGDYQTCSVYGEFVLAQAPFYLLPFAVFAILMQPILQNRVECKSGTTCFCEQGIYFSDSFQESKNLFYRCVEPPEAGIESAEVYAGKGVIKFASPRSSCAQRIE